MVGVGDGPWDKMEEFDDSLPKRQFDNFQFVNYHKTIEECENPDETFALNALMEVSSTWPA
jgi:E3 ubiquitin-protein ligase RGLG